MYSNLLLLISVLHPKSLLLARYVFKSSVVDLRPPSEISELIIDALSDLCNLGLWSRGRTNVNESFVRLYVYLHLARLLVETISYQKVELSCTNGDGSLEITYIVTLYPLSMATAVIVKNQGKKAVQLKSAILSHLKFKSRRGSAVQGLRGCSYCSHPPLPSSFGILSPDDAMMPEPSPGWFSFLAGSPKDDHMKKGSWAVEDDMYTVLRGKLSRVYAAPPTERVKRIYRTPPSKFETIDQGSKLGFRVIRMGYEDIYLSSPGSFSQKYGTDYFICTGPASILVPIVLNPGEDWRGAQVIEHDNL